MLRAVPPFYLGHVITARVVPPATDVAVTTARAGLPMVREVLRINEVRVRTGAVRLRTRPVKHPASVVSLMNVYVAVRDVYVIPRVGRSYIAFRFFQKSLTYMVERRAITYGDCFDSLANCITKERRTMDVRDQSRHQALRRVVVFGEKPWTTLEGVNDGFKEQVAVAKEAVTELDSLAGEDKLKDVRVSRDQENHLLSALYQTGVAPVIRVARVVGRKIPGIARLGDLPKRFNKENILGTAKAVLRSTEAHSELLVAHGLPVDFRTRLEEGIQSVEAQRETTELLRREAVKVTAAIKAALKRGRDAVDCLHPVVQLMCKIDPVNGAATLRAWITAKRVHNVALLPEKDGKSSAPAVEAA